MEFKDDRERWENVSAFIQPYFIGSDDEAEYLGGNVLEWIEISIEVNWDGTHFYSRQRVYKDDLDDQSLSLFLNKMVERIDELMEEHASSLDAEGEAT